MTAVRRLAAGGLASLLALALTLPAYAATKPSKPTRPAAPAPARSIAVLPPQIFQLNPVKVNPSVLPNIMILGQHLTPGTTVQVGGRPATTIQVPDANHLLVKLPENLSQGSYSVAVTNEAGTTLASDALVIDDPSQRPSTMMMLVGGGLLLLLLLVMRLARTPGLA
ncbi:MAG TPA: IPT/TIG domain-containing protein [Candidatus Dormibacteraeota bacterium]|nr:IPT/TIG domain-containing protein [Candidatus Dormibacteraeota bacterium]